MLPITASHSSRNTFVSTVLNGTMCVLASQLKVVRLFPNASLLFSVTYSALYKIEEAALHILSRQLIVKHWTASLSPNMHLWGKYGLQSAEFVLAIAGASFIQFQLGYTLTARDFIVLSGITLSVSLLFHSSAIQAVKKALKKLKGEALPPSSTANEERAKEESVKIELKKAEETTATEQSSIKKPNLKDLYQTLISDQRAWKTPTEFFDIFNKMMISIDEPDSPSLSKEAIKSHNIHKNRYQNVLPYDKNRVKIPVFPLQPSFEHIEDYINASHVKIGNQPFLVTQGPLTHTVKDFWNMVYDNKSPIIVNLTMPIENGRVKCEKYWNLEEETTFSNGLTVARESSEEIIPSQKDGFRDSICIRKFIITKEGEMDHPITQLHYQYWPDHGAPDLELLEKLIAQVNEQLKISHLESPPPIVIHCSAGIGRSGTFLECFHIDTQIAQSGERAENIEIDFLKDIKDMRKQRAGMVQSTEQLQSIYFYAFYRAKLLTSEKLAHFTFRE